MVVVGLTIIAHIVIFVVVRNNVQPKSDMAYLTVILPRHYQHIYCVEH